MFRNEPAFPEHEWQLRLATGGDDGTGGTGGAGGDGDGIATLVLDRPEKLNARSWEAPRQLARLPARVRPDDRIRVLVVRGSGRAFCAGVDLGLPEDRITGRSAAERSRNVTPCSPCPRPRSAWRSTPPARCAWPATPAAAGRSCRR